MKEENELQDNIESVKTLRKPKEKKQRGQLFSIFLTLFGILILLSIISYSKSDAANGDVRFTDLYKIFLMIQF